MNSKRFLAIFLTIVMTLSVYAVAQADTVYDYLAGPIDFSDAVNGTDFYYSGFSHSGQGSLYAMDVDGSKVLKLDRGYYTWDSWNISPNYDSTGKDGVVVEFRIKNALNMALTVGLSSNNPLLKISSEGNVTATDSGKLLCKINANEWYTYTAMIDYSTKTVLFTIKDSLGNVVCNTPHVQSAGSVADQMVAKANSFIRFKLDDMPGAGNYLFGYLDDFSIRAITQDDIASIPEYAITNFAFSSTEALPGEVTASANAMSIASDGQPMTLIVLLKNKSTGGLVSASADIQNVAAVGKTLSAKLTIPDDGNEYEVYAHIWDTFLDMNMLTSSINLK